MKKLLYIFLTVLIVGCSGDDSNNQDNNDEDNNDGDNTVINCSGDNPVYLADNGVTIKACDFAIVGDTGVVNGIGYTIVDRGTLINMISNGDNVTRVCTTRIINMANFVDEAVSAFNQNINSWDVSNVTNMNSMFENATSFNQPIGNWDLSNVTDMYAMFWRAQAFNQPIGDWDVSSVDNMREMFKLATSYNQDLSSWSVDGVTECNNFSAGATSWTLPQPNFTNCTP